jgi:protein subunit release factor A
MEQPIFEEKTLSDVFKDIYENTESKRQQINQFILKLTQLIRTPEDASVIAPVIKDFMEVNVKNDEASSTSDLLTEEEKNQLLSNISFEIDELQEEAKQVEEELQNLRS